MGKLFYYRVLVGMMGQYLHKVMSWKFIQLLKVQSLRFNIFSPTKLKFCVQQ